ncbi:hypothetical protein ACQ7B2_16175, partial [Escherichia coli]
VLNVRTRAWVDVVVELVVGRGACEDDGDADGLEVRGRDGVAFVVLRGRGDSARCGRDVEGDVATTFGALARCGRA